MTLPGTWGVYSTPMLTLPILGPTVWSGAWAETTEVELGPVSGDTTAPIWSSWIEKSIVTSATIVGNSAKVVATSSYVATWPTTYVTPTPQA
jgi:cellulase